MQEDSRTGSTLLGLVAVSVVAVACATAAAPTGELALGTASVEAARSAGAPEFAPHEIEVADAKLLEARDLTREGRNAEARRLAEQAHVDAQAAQARAGAERARRALAQVQAALHEESRRLGAASAHAVQ
jgi:hypothetical protein